MLDEGVTSALISITWEKEGFALADSYDEASGRYLGLVRPGTVDPERYGRNLRLSQEIRQPLTSVDGAQVRISVEIHVERPDGFPDDNVRVILENARTLRLDQSAFEDS